MNSKIDHIAILIDDLGIAEEWYTEKLDGHVTFRDQKYIRIQVANTNIALIDRKHYSNAHFAILIENKEDLPIDQGVVVHHRDGTIGVYVEDPFGNYIEYIWYSQDQSETFLK